MKIYRLFLSLFICVGIYLSNANAQEISHGISIFGDLKYPKNFTHFNYTNPDAPKGGDVKIASVGTFDSLNPFIIKGVAASGITLTFQKLMESSADEASSEYGLIAESVSIADDGSSATFNLRKNAKWHDGTSITAEDVKFSFDTITTKGHPQYKAYYSGVRSADLLSKHTVRFNFKENNNKELPLIVGQLPIISKNYYDKVEFDKTTLTAPMGSGPYRVSSLDAGRSITFERVKDHWAKDLNVYKGRYNFDKITVDYYRDSSIAVEALKAGEYDYRRENISKTWANAYNLPHLTDGRMIKELLPDGSPTGMQSFIFNTRKSDFSNPKIREAISYAYDFEWSNDNLFYGAYSRNNSFFGNSEMAATGLPSNKELELLLPFKNQLPAKVFTETYTPPSTSKTQTIRDNLLIARDILRSEGWFLRNMKLINPETNEPVKIEFMIVSPVFERVIAPFVVNLKKLGIDANIRLVDPSQYIKRREEFDFDIMVHWFTQSSSPGNEQTNFWHSSTADTKGSLNLVGIKNPAADFMVEKITSAKNRNELITACRALDRILQWNFYVIPQWYSRTHRVIYWNKFGRPKNTAPYSLGFEDSWWIDKEKERILNNRLKE